ncbi:MAG: HAD family hydrolase [Deltaproteobacteria bacterium]|nr:HAD family hydrolase [Deltaproteobacteria bacterium]
MGKREVNRAVFLDRDGVINHAIIRDGKAFSPRTREEFRVIEGASAAIRELQAAGFKVLVVTNQPDIARGLLSTADFDWMTERVLSETHVDDLLVCPHDDQHACTCRKPLPGMLLEGAGKWGIDLAQSFMVGDGWKDMEAGKKAGCTCILIDALYNQDVGGDYRIENLKSALEIIIKNKDT